MTARLPARYGAQTSLPSTVQDSVSDCSQLWLFSNWERLPLRSCRAPAAPYLETSVLPSSITSGGLLPAKAASSLVVTLLHCCSSTLTVSLGWAVLNSALTASMTCGGALPSISQTVSVRGPVWACWSPPSSSPPQAARTRARAIVRAARMRCRRGMGPSSFYRDGPWSAGRGPPGVAGRPGRGRPPREAVAAVHQGALG